VFIAVFENYFKVFRYRALGGAAVSPFLPLGLRKRRPRWAAALAGGLLANLKACPARLAACSRVGAAASRSVLTSTCFYTLKNSCL